jgi:hypothetical protein
MIKYFKLRRLKKILAKSIKNAERLKNSGNATTALIQLGSIAQLRREISDLERK